MRYLRMQRPLRRKATAPRQSDPALDLRREAAAENREARTKAPVQETNPRSR